MNDPTSVARHQKNIPTAMRYFLENRSPRYPKTGAMTMYTSTKAVCSSPDCDSDMWNVLVMSVKMPVKGGEKERVMIKVLLLLVAIVIAWWEF